MENLIRKLWNKCRVKCSAEIEPEVQGMGPGERRQLAKKFRNLAHQLEFSAMIQEMDSRPKPPAEVETIADAQSEVELIKHQE
jgi:hypothetical protein